MGGGGCHLINLNIAIERNLSFMVLKLRPIIVYARNDISNQTRVKFIDIWNIFDEIFNYGLCFTGNRLF